MYVISNLTSLKKKEIKRLIQIMHIRCYHIFLLSYCSILLLPHSKESISISWGPAKLILVFEQLDLLQINLTNADLILIISILCSFLVIFLLSILYLFSFIVYFSYSPVEENFSEIRNFSFSDILNVCHFVEAVCSDHLV